MDNLPAHRSVAARDAIHRAGAELRFLPPCSPDFNPIERAFSKLKASLKRRPARTIPELRDAIGEATNTFTSAKCQNYFTAAAYERVRSDSALDQALNAHTRGNWAVANTQLLTFMESLLNEISCLLKPNETENTTSENNREFLGRIDFLSGERKEWSDDGENYINGLFKTCLSFNLIVS